MSVFKVPEKYRILKGPLGSTSELGCNGAFVIQLSGRTKMMCIASDQEGWEHVSVHVISEGKAQTPTWAQMCKVKEFFWDEEDVVMQLHPARSMYVNNHKHVLHLWRPAEGAIPLPDPFMVGIPGLELDK